jgi:hypothetical protein
VRTGGRHLARHELIVGELAIVLVIPLLGGVLDPEWVLASLAAAAAGLVIYKTVRLERVSAGEAADTGRVSAARQDAAHEDAEGPQGRQGRAPEPAEGEVPST